MKEKLIELIQTSLKEYDIGDINISLEIPKNKDYPLEKLLYVDDQLEFVYELYSYTTEDRTYFYINKKSLLNNIEAIIYIYFDSEKDLDSFIDYVFINSDFRMKDIPSLFIEYKNNVIDSGGEIFYVEGENHLINKIIYNTYITMKQ